MTHRTPHTLDAAWLMRLRTISVLGIAVLVTIGRVALALDLPTVPLAVVLTAWLASNVLASAWNARRASPPSAASIAALMALDVVLLTAVFYLTGGPSNPFNFMYLVHIALASVALPPRFAWALAALSVTLFGGLFFDHIPLSPIMPEGHEGHVGHDMDLHLRGMWVAYALAASLVITFTTRVTRALAAREAELANAQAQALRAERLASLATLSAGAAHELATPLSTIAIVAKELELSLRSTDAHGEDADDAQLIRQQVARCRDILDQMAADAGAPTGEVVSVLTPQALIDKVLSGLDEPGRVHVTIEAAAADAALPGLPRSLARALRAIVKNALDASPEGQPVQLACVATPTGWTVSITDQGTGMDPELVDRIGEPFFTTKPTGKGMGLGIFLARAVAEQLGGRLEHTAPPGGGTRATFTLPRIKETP